MSLSQIFIQLAEGFGRCLLIFSLTLLFSLPLALPVTMARMSKFAPLRLATQFFISVMRGTPLMLQLMVVYYGPYYIFGIDISLSYQFYAVIIAFSINYAAYFAEIYRGGIISVDPGQWEAARALGFSNRQTFFMIIFPQVIPTIIPSVANEVITLIKDTSLAMVIAYAEMFTLSKRMVAAQGNILPYAAAAVYYYGFNLLVAWSMDKLEKKLDYNRLAEAG